MKNIFTEHPHSLNESYFEHLFFAAKFGLSMILGGLACITHAICPFLFKDTGSNFLFSMMHNFISRMPPTEERVKNLAQAIDNQAKQHAK